MKRTEAFLPALALLALLIGSVGTASAATPGYAAYDVQYTFMGTSHSIVVNESVSATSNTKYDNLILSVSTGNSTFTYSRSINSSLEISPFLPSITNQTIQLRIRLVDRFALGQAERLGPAPIPRQECPL